MAIYIYYSDEIHSKIKKNIDFLINARSSQNDEELIASINLNILLLSTCYTEGKLEGILKGIVECHRQIYKKINIEEFEIRRPMNILYKSIMNDVKDRISRCQGLENYNNMWKLLMEKSLLDYDEIKILWEPIQILFQLRNVLAHGRQINSYITNAYWNGNKDEEYFFGGYKKAEDYLRKIGLIKARFIENNSSNLFFSNEIIDYFWSAAIDFIKNVESRATLDEMKKFNLKNSK